MNAGTSNQGKVAIGPWTVQRTLLACAAAGDGKTHLSLEGGTQEWVGEGELWKKWEGGEAEARKLAETYGGIAVPRKWVEARAGLADPAAGGAAVDVPRLRAVHRHDRTGEEIA